MNEVNAAIDTITNVGFPIFCVLALGFFFWWMIKENKQESANREERLYTIIGEQSAQMAEQSKQMAELKSSIDNLNNTLMKKEYQNTKEVFL